MTTTTESTTNTTDIERAWLHLANVQLTPRLVSVLLTAFEDDPRAIIAATDLELETAGCPPGPLGRLRDPEFLPSEAQLRCLESGAYRVLWQSHPDFPRVLREIPAAPPVLFVRGQLLDSDRMGVGIVGSRRATPYGRSVAQRFARELAEHGIVVISGGAIGIDTAAHQGALEGGGRTVAIVGCGLDIDYPTSNRTLFNRIAASGAVITEYPFGSQPEAWRFPQRNRLISGLSQGTVVVEAPESSGALNTVRHALDQDRTVMSVPGNIDRTTSVGTNNLIKEGAIPITETADILRALGMVVIPATPPKQTSLDLAFESSARFNPDSDSTGDRYLAEATVSTRPTPSVPLSPEQQRLYACLSLTPRHIDALAQEAGMSAVQAGVEMTLLELMGQVRRLPGNSYIRVR